MVPEESDLTFITINDNKQNTDGVIKPEACWMFTTRFLQKQIKPLQTFSCLKVQIIQTRVYNYYININNMEPFELSAGSDEVNGTYSFAKQISGVSEFWYVKKIKQRKKILEKIYKIRGGGSLPQFGNQFENCWVLQHTFAEGAPPIKYYAAPMKTKYDKLPPSKGWIAIGGIDPVPTIKQINLKQIKQNFDTIKIKVNLSTILLYKFSRNFL